MISSGLKVKIGDLGKREWLSRLEKYKLVFSSLREITNY